jgi:hypothetical protein
VCAFLILLVRVPCTTHLLFLNLITLLIFFIELNPGGHNALNEKVIVLHCFHLIKIIYYLLLLLVVVVVVVIIMWRLVTVSGNSIHLVGWKRNVVRLERDVLKRLKSK